MHHPFYISMHFSKIYVGVHVL